MTFRRRIAAHPHGPTVTALASAGAGAALFAGLGVPAGWLSGAVVGALCAIAAGLSIRVPNGLRDVVFFGLGLSMGAAVTPETIAAIARWPLSILGLALAMLAVMAAVVALLMRAGVDRTTAILASAPGALSTVLILAVDSGAAVRRIVVIQCVRLLALVVLTPPLIAGLAAGAPAPAPVVAPGLLSGPAEWAALIGLGLALALALRRTGLPAPILVGALMGSAALHGTGVATAHIPPEVLIPGFVVLGAFVAARADGIGFDEVRRDIGLALAALAVSVVVAGVAAVLVALATGLALAPVLVAFAPGGVEAMTIMAFALGLDPAYVGAHHVLRFVAIALLLPLAIGMLRAADAPEGRS